MTLCINMFKISWASINICLYNNAEIALYIMRQESVTYTMAQLQLHTYNPFVLINFAHFLISTIVKEILN